MSKKNRTLNKDGSSRKSGSGRKKGATSFVKVPFLDLKDYIGEKTPHSCQQGLVGKFRHSH